MSLKLRDDLRVEGADGLRLEVSDCRKVDRHDIRDVRVQVRGTEKSPASAVKVALNNTGPSKAGSMHAG